MLDAELADSLVPGEGRDEAGDQRLGVSNERLLVIACALLGGNPPLIHESVRHGVSSYSATRLAHHGAVAQGVRIR